MAGKIVSELRAKWDAATRKIKRQLEGMDAHMERSDGPGEWTTREVLCHLLGEPGGDSVARLKTFAARDLPVIDIAGGKMVVTEERRKMTLKQFVDALERHGQGLFAYLESLSDAELTGRKARIPVFKQFMGTDEVPLQAYVGAQIELHLTDHAGQLGKIRKAAGLAEVS